MLLATLAPSNNHRKKHRLHPKNHRPLQGLHQARPVAPHLVRPQGLRQAPFWSALRATLRSSKRPPIWSALRASVRPPFWSPLRPSSR